MKCGKGVICRKLPSKREFHENRLCNYGNQVLPAIYSYIFARNNAELYVDNWAESFVYVDNWAESFCLPV